MSHDLIASSLPQMNVFQRLCLYTAMRHILVLCLCGLIVLLAACGTPAASTSSEQIQAANDDAADDADTGKAESDEEAESASTGTTGTLVEIDPYPPAETTGPVRVQIEEIGLDAPVIAMGWRVDVVDGERTTVWDVPLDLAGWHINSVGAGGLGNMVISGRQVEGAAVFAPLALGSVAPGQEVLVTDGDGITFVYRIVEVTDPIPVTGATPDELARGASYFEPTTTAQLTLVTGWPDFTTTHRIFAVAEFVGVLR